MTGPSSFNTTKLPPICHIPKISNFGILEIRDDNPHPLPPNRALDKGKAVVVFDTFEHKE